MHLENVRDQTGITPEALANAKPLPYLVSHLWGWFVSLCNDRQSNGMGISRITSSDIRNWCWRTGNKPSYWEMDVLMRLDSKWIDSQPKPKS